MKEFELDPERRAKVKRYYHELESGLLDPAGLDERLADLLARTLRSTRDAILAWRPRPLAAGPAYRVSEARYRLEALPPPEVDESPDEVDKLFHSGL